VYFFVDNRQKDEYKKLNNNVKYKRRSSITEESK
jgi:hypothetical protein